MSLYGGARTPILNGLRPGADCLVFVLPIKLFVEVMSETIPYVSAVFEIRKNSCWQIQIIFPIF